MTDAKRRHRERDMENADPNAMAADQARAGLSRIDWLRKYVGKRVYIEGVRMNYLGTLDAITTNYSGEPGELVMRDLIRVGEWNRSGPVSQYCMDMPSSQDFPAWIPWAAVDQFGLAPEGW